MKKKVSEDKLSDIYEVNGEENESGEKKIVQEEISEEVDDNELFSTENPNNYYTKSHLIGSGAFGSVYIGKTKDNEKVAIKKSNAKKHSTIKKIYKREIQFLKECACPYIVRYVQSFLYKKSIWIIMEYIDGGTLKTFHKLELKSDSIAYILKCILEGLTIIHQNNIIHRDIKDDNILIGLNGDIKIGDFGLSVRSTAPRSNKSISGTRRWIAPEVYKKQGYGKKIDIWSLGCLSLVLSTRKLPYSSFTSLKAIYYTSHYGIMNELDLKQKSSFKKFLQKCFQSDPDKRPTAQELLNSKFIVENSKDFDQKTIIELLKYSLVLRAESLQV